MKELIDNFPQQIIEALEIGEKQNIQLDKNRIQNIVVCGLGGSGIGATFVKDMVIKELSIPFEIVKGYVLPHFVNENTLVVASSYSGNTEETVNCYTSALTKNAQIISITSNGIISALSKENNTPCISIPGGMPPRACLGYSSIQLFYVLYNVAFISSHFKSALKNTAQLLEENKKKIKEEASFLANELFDKIPVLYSEDAIESVTIRWRQQINENGKELCWHHVIPEMNHNELVGWREKNENIAVVMLRHSFEHERNQKRFTLNSDVIKDYTPHIFEVKAKGESLIEQAMFLINIGDWLSYFLSEKRGFDPAEVSVIDALKKNLND